MHGQGDGDGDGEGDGYSDGEGEGECDEECEGEGDGDGKSQLWKTTVHSLRRATDSEDNISCCICCCKPVLKQDHGTRKMDMRAVFMQLLHDPAALTMSPLYRCQHAHLAAARETYVCYICEPMCKRALRQYEDGKTVTHPSLFMLNSLCYVQDTMQKIDKLSLIKAYLCCMMEITTPSGCAYHPARSKHFEMLEGVIVFMRSIFETYQCNVRTFSRDTALCPFIVTSVVHWHAGGCQFVFDDMKTSSRVRRLFKGPLNTIYGTVFHDDSAFDMLAMYRDGLLQHNSACAACAQETVPVHHTSYESCFLLPPAVVNTWLTHAPHPRRDVPGCTLMCLRKRGISARSWGWYCRFSRDFPPRFVEKSKHRFFHDIMVAAEQ